MNKMKHWLFERFLPAWCREELLEENEKLLRRLETQRQEITRLNAYLDGMETALRLGRRIQVHNSVQKEAME